MIMFRIILTFLLITSTLVKATNFENHNNVVEITNKVRAYTSTTEIMFIFNGLHKAALIPYLGREIICNYS